MTTRTTSSTASPDADSSRKSSLSTLKGLIPFMAPYRRQFILAGIALLFAAGATLAIPAAFGAVRLGGPEAPLASLAYAAVHDGLACINMVATDPAARRRGLSRRVLLRLLAWAREAGADIVIVFPHWGAEYSARPFTGQQRLARQIIDAGADMVIGNHAHWAGAMEVYKGKPIWYALGNFVFDQTWSEPTMEGITEWS